MIIQTPMPRTGFFLMLVVCLALLPPQARSQMPGGLPTAIDGAVGICLDLIAGNQPRKPGPFKKTNVGFVRAFDQNAPGVLESQLRLNGSNVPRVDVAFSNDRVCSISMMRMGGGYAQHFAQLRAAFARRGWDYKRQSIVTMSKGDRLMSTNGGTTTRDRAGDVLTNFLLIEWVRDGRGQLKRLY